MAHRGSCLCGSVTYEIGVLPETAFNCHCSACRKAHGAAFVPWGFLPRDQFRWTSGEALLATFASSPSAQRIFCSRCGSQLGGHDPSALESMAITLGTLADDAGLQPAHHIFVGSKAPWHEIGDSLPQFDEWDS